MTKAAELAKMGEVLTNSQIGGRRNIAINGAMQVAQRGTSVTGLGAADAYHTVDRFMLSAGNTAGRLTASQTADGPSGFANCLKLDCTTADTSIAAGERLIVRQSFEGQDVQQIKKGTSDAEKVTVSFYVKGNATATYTCELVDEDNNRYVAQEFSVTTSWTKIVKTFVADTTGAFNDDNAHSMSLNIWLHAGSTFTGGTFASNTVHTTANQRVGDNQTSFYDSTDRTFFLTGVQLEVGEQATPFEHRSFGEELALCQRYFFRTPDGGNSGASTAYQILGSGYIHNSTTYLGHLIFPKTMRTTPTCSNAGLINVLDTTGNRNITSMSLDHATSRSVLIDATISGGTAGQGALFRLENDSDGYIQADSEL
jgi:hypothetical protein